jgi:hypothetical protein
VSYLVVIISERDMDKRRKREVEREWGEAGIREDDGEGESN